METTSHKMERVAQTQHATDDPELSIKNFNFYYNKFHAIKNVNMDIHRRRVTAFIGPSGCGKSTLLRAINRMYDL